MIEKTFERLWDENRKRLLAEDEEYQRIQQSYRKHGWADWVIFAATVVGCLELVQRVGIKSQVLSFAIAIVLALIFFVFYIYFKAIKVSRRTLEEVEERIKAEYRKSLGR